MRETSIQNAFTHFTVVDKSKNPETGRVGVGIKSYPIFFGKTDVQRRGMTHVLVDFFNNEHALENVGGRFYLSVPKEGEEGGFEFVSVADLKNARSVLNQAINSENSKIKIKSEFKALVQFLLGNEEKTNSIVPPLDLWFNGDDEGRDEKTTKPTWHEISMQDSDDEQKSGKALGLARQQVIEKNNDHEEYESEDSADKHSEEEVESSKSESESEENTSFKTLSTQKSMNRQQNEERSQHSRYGQVYDNKPFFNSGEDEHSEKTESIDVKPYTNETSINVKGEDSKSYRPPYSNVSLGFTNHKDAKDEMEGKLKTKPIDKTRHQGQPSFKELDPNAMLNKFNEDITFFNQTESMKKGNQPSRQMSFAQIHGHEHDDDGRDLNWNPQNQSTYPLHQVNQNLNGPAGNPLFGAFSGFEGRPQPQGYGYPQANPNYAHPNAYQQPAGMPNVQPQNQFQYGQIPNHAGLGQPQGYGYPQANPNYAHPNAYQQPAGMPNVQPQNQFQYGQIPNHAGLGQPQGYGYPQANPNYAHPNAYQQPAGMPNVQPQQNLWKEGPYTDESDGDQNESNKFNKHKGAKSPLKKRFHKRPQKSKYNEEEDSDAEFGDYESDVSTKVKQLVKKHANKESDGEHGHEESGSARNSAPKGNLNFRDGKARVELKQEFINKVSQPIQEVSIQREKLRQALTTEVGSKPDAGKSAEHKQPAATPPARIKTDYTKKTSDWMASKVTSTFQKSANDALEDFKKVKPFDDGSIYTDHKKYKANLEKMYDSSISMLSVGKKLEDLLVKEIDEMEKNYGDSSNEKEREYIKRLIAEKQQILDFLKDEDNLPDPNAFLQKVAETAISTKHAYKKKGPLAVIKKFIQNIRKKLSFIEAKEWYTSSKERDSLVQLSRGKDRGAMGSAEFLYSKSEFKKNQGFTLAMKKMLKKIDSGITLTFNPDASKMERLTEEKAWKKSAGTFSQLATLAGSDYKTTQGDAMGTRPRQGTRITSNPVRFNHSALLEAKNFMIAEAMLKEGEKFYKKAEAFGNFINALKMERGVTADIVNLKTPAQFISEEKKISQTLDKIKELSPDIHSHATSKKEAVFKDNADFLSFTTNTLEKQVDEVIENAKKSSTHISAKIRNTETAISTMTAKLKKMYQQVYNDIKGDEKGWMKDLSAEEKLAIFQTIASELEKVESLGADIETDISLISGGKDSHETLNEIHTIVTTKIGKDDGTGVDEGFTGMKTKSEIKNIAAKIEIFEPSAVDKSLPQTERMSDFIAKHTNSYKTNNPVQIILSKNPALATKKIEFDGVLGDVLNLKEILQEKIAILEKQAFGHENKYSDREKRRRSDSGQARSTSRY